VVRAADAGNVANRYCLRFDRGVVGEHETLLCQTSSNNGWQHSQHQQHEPLLCQTSSNNGWQHSQHQQHEPLLCQTVLLMLVMLPTVIT
jgi:hypothetical protein